MKIEIPDLLGPFTQSNLTVFLIAGREAGAPLPLVSLQEAMDQKLAVVYETGSVGELEVENTSDMFDVYIQAGDIVKGGRQDRTLGTDFIVPAKSGRLPIPSFCVEAARWHGRGSENARAFSSSSSSLTRSLRLPVMTSRSQQEVWHQVAETQRKLSSSVRVNVRSRESATSYQLTLENRQLQATTAQYRTALAGEPAKHGHVIGCVFAVNGKLAEADTYPHPALFGKMWDKLLERAIVEALAEAAPADEAGTPAQSVSAPVPEPAQVVAWLAKAEGAAVRDTTAVQPVVQVTTKEAGDTLFFETSDTRRVGTWVHRNYLSKHA